MRLISIIVPVYNVDKYLSKCLDSIINQTYSELEIILIDDGSVDKSGNICDEYADKDKRIKVMHKKNEGVSVARNIGLEMATGEYIGFVDGDDYIAPDMFEKLYNNLIDNSADVSICDFYFVKNGTNKKASQGKLNVVLKRQNAMKELLLGRLFAGHLWNKLFKSDIAKKIQFAKDIYVYEDLLFVWNYLKECDNVHYTSDALYYYVMRNTSACHSKLSYKQLSAEKVVEKIYNECIAECSELRSYAIKNIIHMWLGLALNIVKSEIDTELMCKQLSFVKSKIINRITFDGFWLLKIRFKVVCLLLCLNEKLFVGIAGFKYKCKN